jgi:hypothetical protein
LYWEFPLWLDYSFMQIQWCLLTGIFAFTFGLASAIALRTAHRERHKVAIASVLLVAAIQIMRWNYTRPVAEKLKDDITAAGMVSQTSPVSCAAARLRVERAWHRIRQARPAVTRCGGARDERGGRLSTIRARGAG